MQEIAARELQAWLATAAPVVVDVREPWETAICAVAGARHIPLSELPKRVTELDRRTPTVLLCHHGVRSRHAAEWLATQGFEALFNLTGGIDEWAREIDSNMTRY